MSTKYDITPSQHARLGYRILQAGDDYDYTFTASNVNLTGATIWFTIKRKVEDLDSSALLQYSSINPLQISLSATPTDGVFVVHFAAADTADMFGFTLVYDVKVKLGPVGNNKIVHIVYGNIEFAATITRRVS